MVQPLLYPLTHHLAITVFSAADRPYKKLPIRRRLVRFEPLLVPSFAKADASMMLRAISTATRRFGIEANMMGAAGHLERAPCS